MFLFVLMLAGIKRDGKIHRDFTWGLIVWFDNKGR